MKQNIRKQMTFPAELVTLVEEKGKRYGFGFNETVRFFLANAVKDETLVEIADENVNNSVKEVLQDIGNKDYRVIKDQNELDSYFKEIEE